MTRSVTSKLTLPMKRDLVMSSDRSSLVSEERPANCASMCGVGSSLTAFGDTGGRVVVGMNGGSTKAGRFGQLEKKGFSVSSCWDCS